MKKFALGFFGFLFMFAGTFLFACQPKKVSVSVSVQEVTIFTNDANAENFKQAKVEVSLQNSSAGVWVEVVEGQDCVYTSPATRKADGKFLFTINAEKSGEAKVKVSAVDDVKQFQEIDVHVKTLVEGLSVGKDDSAAGRSNLFIIKGGEKLLDAEEFFDFQPTTANVKDVQWSFEKEVGLTISDNVLKNAAGTELARIDNGKLFVNENCNLEKITLRASFALDNSVFNTISFQVLENSTIASLTLEGFLGESWEEVSLPQLENEETIFQLKRNDATKSSITGTLVVNSAYDITLKPVFKSLKTSQVLQQEDVSDFLKFNITRKQVSQAQKKVTYTFVIDALDDGAIKQFADFSLGFLVGYRDFNFDIPLDSLKTVLSTSYAVEGVELSDANGNALNNGVIDVFSSYSNGYGFLIKTLLIPEDVAVDNNLFYISVDVNNLPDWTNGSRLSQYLKFYVRGRQLEFTNVNGQCRSSEIASGTEVYVCAVLDNSNLAGGIANTLPATLNDINLQFVPISDSTKRTSITANLMKISSGTGFEGISDFVTGESLQGAFLSSSNLSQERSKTFQVKIDGISKLSGLELVHEQNPRFSFSALNEIAASAPEAEQQFIVVEFTVSLVGSNFDAATSFWFTHITGKTSENQKTSVVAFVPLTNASISLENGTAANVFINKTAAQNFVVTDGVLQQGQLTNTSLSHLLVEAGTTVPLHFEKQSLSQEVVFKFVSFQALQTLFEEDAEMLFRNDGWMEYASRLHGFCQDVDENLFSINASSLTVKDVDFKGFVFAFFNAYDAQHNEIVAVRAFALESFYAANFLTSNVKEKVLYTAQSLSASEMARSRVDVVLSMRSDDKVPTYASLSNFRFVSSNLNEFQQVEGGLKNDYYSISNLRFSANGRNLRFRITANSTNLQATFDDVLSVLYEDGNGISRRADIELQIRNVARIEKVDWVNAPANGEIYLNLTSVNLSERTATISTSISPVDANDKGLGYIYYAETGNKGFLGVQTNEVGQTFNLSIVNTQVGGTGWLYILPKDMIKNVNGTDRVLLYKYSRNLSGEIVGVQALEDLALEDLNFAFNDIMGIGEKDKDEGIYSNYFLNDNGQEVYYKDILLKIKVTIADGLTEDTAIRIYNPDELVRIDRAKYYQIMNNMTLNNWKSFETFSGMIFGANQSVTLTMGTNSENFINNNKGFLRDLTFAGTVSSSQNKVGFVAGENSGTLQNIVVDVNVTNQSITSSRLIATSTNESLTVGGIVGNNSGRLQNCKNLGLSIDANHSIYTGGIAGTNSGTITDCGVEFYNFSSSAETIAPNTIQVGSGGNVGGIVGLANGSSKIVRSYAYAYPLANKTQNSVSKIIFGVGESGKIALFMAHNEAGAKVQESFAFLGDVKAPTFAKNSDGKDLTYFENSYLTYFNTASTENQDFSTVIFTNNTFAYQGSNTVNYGAIEVDASLIPKNGTHESALPSIWQALLTSQYANIWAAGKVDQNGVWTNEGIDSAINFGFMHLKNVTQNVALKMESVAVQNVFYAGNENYAQALDAGQQTENGKIVRNGILMLYDVQENITLAADAAALVAHNTISFADLFGVSEKEAQTMLVTTASLNVSINSTSIRMLSTNVDGFDLTVHSKMDFTQAKDFHFVVINNIPLLRTSVQEVALAENETIFLQKNTSTTVVSAMDNTIHLNGRAYQTTRGAYSFDFDFVGETDEEFSVVASRNGGILSLLGKTSGKVSKLKTFITYSALPKAHQEALQAQRTRNFAVSVFDGATDLRVENTNRLSFKTSEYAVIDVLLETDNANDNLVFGLQYGQRQWTATGENFAEIEVDGKLTLQLQWTKLSDENPLKFRIVAKVDSEKRWLIDQDYNNLILSINAKSQADNVKLVQSVVLNVKKQNVEDVSLHTYSISNRSVRYGINYYRASSNIISTITPGTDAILAISASPAYANMTHMILSYQAQGTTGLGNVTFSKLAYSKNWGFYANSSGTIETSNGLQVNFSDQERQGDGVYYFRMYVSSAFSASTTITLRAEFFNGQDLQYFTFINLKVDFQKQASIVVGALNSEVGQKTYLLPKGETAKVTVTLEDGQNLYALYLQNQLSNIDISAWTQVGHTYTAYVTAYVDAATKDGSGVVSVCADVERVVGGVQEIKTSKATICIVDFSLNVTANDGKVTSGISLATTGSTASFNGNTYDVFHSYVGAKDSLAFAYDLAPENYSYNSANPSEVEAVEKMLQKRKNFFKTNHHEDDELGYYINNRQNASTGKFEALTLKQQLSYATNENYSNPIYNENYGYISKNDIFEFEENADGSLSILGTRTGRQLMKLTTTVFFQDREFVYDYYFLVVVDLWTDEETPTIITSGQEFVDFATKSEQADDYILMNDIVLENYSPLNTNLIKSLDGNGFTIHLNSFALPEEGGTLNLALFGTVNEGTTLKNVRVNIYGAGQIDVDVTKYTTINLAGFAVENNGVIYNCEVISYKSTLQSVSRASNGLVAAFMLGANTDPIFLTQSMQNARNIEISVCGFVCTNNASITNSRVGGEKFNHIVEIAGQKYVETQNLGAFSIVGQHKVSGFVGENNGNISASFAKAVDIKNEFASTTSLTAGFALENRKSIQNSYVEGVFAAKAEDVLVADGSSISSLGVVAGFVHTNSAVVKNSYANIAIENSKTKPAYAAGFVYENDVEGEISLCYTACKIENSDINQTFFSGVDDLTNPLNKGKISSSYFYSTMLKNDGTEGVTAVRDLKNEAKEVLYGFNFESADEKNDGIWETTSHGISLVSANNIAFSNRYAVSNGNLISIFYTRSITNSSTFQSMDLSYGSKNNPIIIRNAYDFAVATGNATAKEISSYKEYYSDDKVFGNYRLVNDINMEEIDQNVDDSSEGAVVLKTTTKTFTGSLDANGFTISNINLGSSDADLYSYGLFSKLDGAVVMNVNFVVDSIHNARASVVGTLAGVAVDSTIIAISIEPSGSTAQESTSILGNNIVGGVVGILSGNSVLYDVKANNIEVYSSYNGGTKNSSSNKEAVNELRKAIAQRMDLTQKTASLSYAGSVVGFLDVFENENEFAQYSTLLRVVDYSVVSVHVDGNISVYGEVAGGLFGYVGKGTYIYDATLEVSNPSYIVSKNLFAGGLVGENYGGLFAVSAQYDKATQENIEKGEHAFYASGNGQERGQMDIFSFKQNVDDAPLYVGGIAGAMGGGFVYVGFSKLNAVSQTPSTVAAGGLVGLATKTDAAYQLAFVHGTVVANMYFGDVYSSGDVQTKAGVSAGLVGALETDSTGETAVIAMKNVVAANYFSDLESIGKNTDGEASTFGLLGKLVEVVDGKDKVREDEGQTLKTQLLFVTYDNDAVDVSKNNQLTGTLPRSYTVGGYSQVVHGTITQNIVPYGFDVSWAEKNDETYQSATFEKLLQLEHIGSGNLSTMEAAYVRFSSNFLPNGWSDEFWAHEKDCLFPNITLIPKDTFVYWDAYEDSTKNVLKRVKDNPYITIIVRGKANNDDSFVVSDINLTEIVSDSEIGKLLFSEESVFNDFAGTIISFRSYFSAPFGVLATDSGIGGGKAGSDPGLILDRSLFNVLKEGSTVEGLNLYLKKDKTVALSEKESKEIISYSLVNDIATGTVFRDLNIHLRSSANIETKEVGSKIVGSQTIKMKAAGLIAASVNSCTFMGIKFDAGQNEIAFTQSKELEEQTGPYIYAGLLAGYIEHNSRTSSMSIQQVTFASENVLNVKFNFNDFSKVYGGLYVGAIERTESTTKAILEIVAISQDVELTFENLNNNETKPAETESAKEIYVGGFVGTMQGVSEISLQSGEENKKGILSIVQNTNVTKLIAGLAFGEVQSDVSINQQQNVNFNGNILQGVTATTNSAQIGGLVGHIIGGNAVVSGFSSKLLVARLKAVKNSTGGEIPSYIKTEGEGENAKQVDIFTQNSTEYELSPFLLSDTTSSVDNGFGGIIGYAQNSNIKLSGNIKMEGTIDVAFDSASQTKAAPAFSTVSVGGLIGKMLSGNFVMLDGEIENSINIAVGQNESNSEISKANVGGMVGWISASAENNEIEISNKARFDGNVLSSVKNINFGGAIGLIDGNSGASAVDGVKFGKFKISNIVFGGALKVYGSGINQGSVVVGGVVGEAGKLNGDKAEKYPYIISNARIFGDVFVIYDDGTDASLQKYDFGGIVGSGKCLHIQNCSTLLSSFNSKYVVQDNAVKALAATSAGEVFAVVGNNHTENTYEGNKYSSGVNFAYQMEEGNVDCGFGDLADGAYEGYTCQVTKTEGTKPAEEQTASNILVDFADYVSAAEEGHKLNPKMLESETDSADSSALEKLHNISWVAMKNGFGKTYDTTGDGNTTETLFKQMQNTVFVGNGQVLTVSDTRSATTATTFGGVADIMQEFAIISGLRLSLNVMADIGVRSEEETNSSVAGVYGGVAGSLGTNSMIYAVGVTGKLSVGGKAGELLLGGVVGQQSGGKISESFVDAQIAYRAGNGGKVAGIANLCGHASTIERTYSSGLIQTYVDVPLFTFASITDPDSTRANEDATNCIEDCYSISAVARTIVENTSQDSKRNFFIAKEEVNNAIISYNDNYSNFVGANKQVHNWCENLMSTANTICATKALPFGATNLIYGWESFSAPTEEKIDKIAADITGKEHPTDTKTKWYFNPYCNYGYATHGFGFLKNVTTYTREVSNYAALGKDETANAQISTVVPEYTYNAVSYKYVLEYGTKAELYSGNGEIAENNKWFLGVNNAGKLQQMLDAVKAIKPEGTTNAYYSNNFSFRFVINNNIDMAKFAGSFGQDVGVKEKDLVIDGRGHTLDFSFSEADETYVKEAEKDENGNVVRDENGNVVYKKDGENINYQVSESKASAMSSSFLGTVVGNLENLKIAGIKVGSSTKTSLASGTLANNLTGCLMNVTVVGNLNTNSGIAGGVVGTLEGNATAVEAVVNVTAKNADKTGSIVGGVAGVVKGSETAPANISYSSNSGQLIVKGTPDAYATLGKNIFGNVNISFIPLGPDGKTAAKQAKRNLNGEILKDENGNIVYSEAYSTQNANVVVGGVVGYATGATITQSYNTNAVLANFNSNTDINSIAGGVVGFATGSTLTNLFNTGLVGAGNFETKDAAKNYSFAGGVVGYAQNLKSKVSDCVNDGQVEANGKMPKIDHTAKASNVAKDETAKTTTYTYDNYQVKFKLKPGSQEESESKENVGFTNDPKSLTYDVTLTMNPEKNRQVYAYGIGFIGKMEGVSSTEGFDSNNFTSTDNIKNDGCIGEVSETQIMTFDRKAILDNELKGTPLDFMGKFDIVKDKNVIAYDVNGIDSYGFPNRIYSVDQIERIYAKSVSSKSDEASLTYKGTDSLTNDIFKAYSAYLPYKETGIANYVGKFNVDGTSNARVLYAEKAEKAEKPDEKWKETNKNWAMQGNNKNAMMESVVENGVTIGQVMKEGEQKKKESGKYKHDSSYGFADILDAEAFLMPETTRYYSSVRFTPYDSILETGAATGLVAYNCSVSGTDAIATNKSTGADVEVEISEVEQKTESEKSLSLIEVNGEETALVASADNFLAAVAPHKYTGEATISIDKTQALKQNFVVTRADGNPLQAYKIDSITINEGQENVTATVKFTAYLSSGIGESAKFNLIYKTTKHNSITLRKNNVEAEQGGRYWKVTFDKSLLPDGDELTGVEIQWKTQIKTINMRFVEDNDRNGEKVVLRLEKDDSWFDMLQNGATLWLTATRRQVSEVESDSIEMQVFNKTEEVQIATPDMEFGELKYVGFETRNFAPGTSLWENVYEKSETSSETPETEPIGTKIKLENILNGVVPWWESGKDLENVRFAAAHTEYQIKFEGREKNNALKGWAVNNIITASYELSIEFDEAGAGWLVVKTKNIEGFQAGFNALTWYVSKNEINYSPAGEGESDVLRSFDEMQTTNGLQFKVTYTLADKQGDFTSFGSYGKNAFAFEGLKDSEFVKTTETKTIFGLKFSTKLVKFAYYASKVSVSSKEEAGEEEAGMRNKFITKLEKETFAEDGTTSTTEEIFVSEPNKVLTKESTIEISDIKIGDKLKVNFNVVRMDGNASASGFVVTVQTSGNQYRVGTSTAKTYADFIESFRDGEESDEQAIAKAKENPVVQMIVGEGNTSTVTRKYLKTTVNDEEGNSQETMVFDKLLTIYANGTISLETGYTEDEVMGKDSILFVQNSDGVTYEVHTIKKAVSVKPENGEGITSDDETFWWNYEAAREIVSKTDLMENFEVVAGSIRNGEIFFEKVEKSEGENGCTLTVAGRIEIVTETEVINSISLVKDCIDSFTLSDEGAVISGFKYREKGTNAWIGSADNQIPKIEKNDIVEFEYQYQSATSHTINCVKLTQDQGKNIKACPNIVLKDDVHLSTAIYGETALKNLLGQKHVLKYVESGKSVTDSVSIFEKALNLRDFALISTISLEDAKEESYSILPKIDNGKLYENLKLFGNIRNVTAENGLFVSPIKVGLNGEINAVADNIVNLKSYVAITGKDQQSTGNGVLAKLQDFVVKKDNSAADKHEYASVSQYDSHNILLAGNGMNAENGKDTKWKPNNITNETSTTVHYISGCLSRCGGNATQAGKGGSVSVTTNFAGLARVGTSGFGGYGGNAENGRFYDNVLYHSGALSGGVGGTASVKADRVGLQIDGNDATADNEKNVNKLAERTVTDAAQYSGNGGIGGFGRVVTIDDRNEYYLSAAANSSENSKTSYLSWTATYTSTNADIEESGTDVTFGRARGLFDGFEAKWKERVKEDGDWYTGHWESEKEAGTWLKVWNKALQEKHNTDTLKNTTLYASSKTMKERYGFTLAWILYDHAFSPKIRAYQDVFWTHEQINGGGTFAQGQTADAEFVKIKINKNGGTGGPDYVYAKVGDDKLYDDVYNILTKNTLSRKYYNYEGLLYGIDAATSKENPTQLKARLTKVIENANIYYKIEDLRLDANSISMDVLWKPIGAENQTKSIAQEIVGGGAGGNVTYSYYFEGQTGGKDNIDIQFKLGSNKLYDSSGKEQKPLCSIYWGSAAGTGTRISSEFYWIEGSYKRLLISDGKLHGNVKDASGVAITDFSGNWVYSKTIGAEVKISSNNY